MSVLARVLRRLGLGGAVCRLLSPFAMDRRPLPTPEAARAALEALRPDAGGSCLWTRPAAPAEYEVDVIIPVYNAAPYLARCLDSVLGQDCSRPFRVIAVDDGSTDASPEILAACRDPRLLCLRQENAGAGAARNAGLRVSRAAYVFFLDADDVMLPGCLERLCACAADSGADLVQAAYRTVDAHDRPLCDYPQTSGRIDPRRDCTGFPHGKLFRASLFDRVRFPEGYLFEDSVLAQVLYPLAAREGRFVLGLDFPCLGYRLHGQNISRRSRGSAASLDTLWITLSLSRDRESLGLAPDQDWYEYLLNMLVLSLRRTELLDAQTRRALFAVYADFLRRGCSSFSTARPAFRMLERAVRGGDYGRCRLFCALH